MAMAFRVCRPNAIRGAIAGWLLCAAPSLSAQLPQAGTLKAPDGVLKEPFVWMSANVGTQFPRQLHELTDGRVIIAESIGRQRALVNGSYIVTGEGSIRAVIADFVKGTVDTLRDVPASNLFQLPADTSVINTTRGWIFLHGTKPIGMLPADNPVVFALRGPNPISPRTVVGMDNRGFVYGRIENGTSARDSSLLVRINRTTGVQEEITRLASTAEPRPPGGGERVCNSLEQVRISLDGWIAVLRANPYRVDWRSPAGEWSLGAPVPVPGFIMTDDEKAAHLAWRAKDRLAEVGPDDVRSWPESMCPWHGGYPPMLSPDGKLLVYRVPSLAAPATRYDVVNRRGEVERQLVLPASEVIVGFGRASVFVAATSEKTQQIRRHPWP